MSKGFLRVLAVCRKPPKSAARARRRRRRRKRTRKPKGNPSPSTPHPLLELPPDIIANILHKLGAVEILETAQKVCTTWRSLCKNPSMWHVIDMRTDDEDNFHLVEICRHAVDRSQGQLVEIHLDQLFSDDQLIDYIATRCGNLRRLRLVSYLNLDDGGLTETTLKRFPKLELLDVSVYSRFYNEAIEMVGRACPLLTSFALTKIVFGRSSFNFHSEAFGSTSADDEEAFAIARSMPKLRHLKLVENNMTNKGLEAIIDDCPLLESLDLFRCYHLELEGSALKERLLSQIKCLKWSECTVPEHLREINWHDM